MKINKKFKIINKVVIIFIFMILSNNPSNLINYFHKNYKNNLKLWGNIENYYKLCNNGILNNKKKFRHSENPKISIISPNHNRGKYILRLLRSIQNQFFDDLEIILVDDFSNDNSIELIEKYQKDDERIILIKHKKNKGTLISRNVGILNSKGEYIIIPDVDDILAPNILQTCYDISKKNNYELIRFNIYIGNESIFFDNIVDGIEVRQIYQPELSTYLFYGKGDLQQIDFNLSNKFIKRISYIRALNSMNNFYLNQYMVNLEDGIMNYILYRTAKSFYFIKKIGYYYLQNNQSITVKQTENYDEKIRFIFIHLKFVFENTKNNKYEKEMADSLFSRLYILLENDFNLIKKDYKFYIDIINMYLNCNFVSDKNKFILIELKSIIKKKEINKIYK